MKYTESFVFYESVRAQVEHIEKCLGKERAYDVLLSIIDYGLYGIEPPEEYMLYGLDTICCAIDGAKQRYDKSVENGKRGGRKKEISREKVKELKDKGYTNKDIAEELNCSVSAIEKIIAEFRKNTIKTDFTASQQQPIKTAGTHNNLNENVNDNDNEKDNGKFSDKLYFDL